MCLWAPGLGCTADQNDGKLYMSCLQLQVFFSSRMTAVQLKNSREFSWSGSRIITSLIYYFKSPITFYNSKLQQCNFELQKTVYETERKHLRSYGNVETELTAAHLFIALIKSMRTPSITNRTCNSFKLSNVDENSNHHNFASRINS
jgi:hypothetical protein